MIRLNEILIKILKKNFRYYFDEIYNHDDPIQIIDIEDETHYIENPYMELIDDNIPEN